MAESEWEPLKRGELVSGRKVMIAPSEILNDCLQKSKLLQKARDEGALRTLVGLFAGQPATVLEAPPTNSVRDMDGMCKIRTSVGTTASLPIGSIGIDPEAERDMKLKYEQNAAHDIAASEVQESWRKNNARKSAVVEVQRLREERDILLNAKRVEELNRQSGMVQELAAISIQACLRGAYTRLVLKGVKKKKIKTYDVQDPEVINAVTLIESHVRGSLTRNASKRERNKRETSDQAMTLEDDKDDDYLGFQRNDHIFPVKTNAPIESSDICTKFLTACSNGDLHSVHIMCRDQGVNIHCADPKGNSGVLCACPGGHLDVIRFLQSEGGSLILGNFKGWSPLHRACFYGKIDVAEYIIETLARQGTTENPLALTNHLGATPLHVAIPNGHGSICEMLVNSGAPLNARNASGDTPLSFAVICRKPELASFLVQSGADLTVKNNEGLIPSEVAKRMNQHELAIMLAPKTVALREDLTRGVEGEHWNDVNLSRHNKKSSNHQLLKHKQQLSSSELFGPLKVDEGVSKLKKGGNKMKSKALKEDTKIIDLLLQGSNAVWSRRELVRRAWLASCPICDEFKMKLQELHTILHVLGILPPPPQKDIGTNSFVRIRLDKPQHTAADLITASDRLGMKADVSTSHGATTRNKLLSLIRCPKGATALIAERKRTKEWGEGTGRSLLQRLDLPDSTIDVMPCRGMDLMEVNEDSISMTPMLNVLPSVIKRRLLFHCEMLRTLAELESSKVATNKTAFSATANTTPASHANNQRAQHHGEKDSLNGDSIGRDVVIDEAEDGGWLTSGSTQVGENIQVAHFEELANCLSRNGASLSAEALKLARRAASSKGKVVGVDDSDHVLVSLEDDYEVKLPYRAVYHIPLVLTSPQLYVGANARVVKMGWLKQLLCDINPKQNMFSREDQLLVDRFSGALVVVSNIEKLEQGLVSVKAADGFEAELPSSALTPPPIDAALKLLFRNSVTSVNSDLSGNMGDGSYRGMNHRSKASSSHASFNSNGNKSPTKKKKKHVINLRMPQTSSSQPMQIPSTRPLYREVNEDIVGGRNHEEEGGGGQPHQKTYEYSMNRVPYVPDQMLRDGRVSDELGRGVKGIGTATQRPKTAHANISSHRNTPDNRLENENLSSTKYDDGGGSEDLTNGFNQSRRGQQRPKSAGLNGKRREWTPVTVQSFDFTSAQPKKKDKSKEKPEMKFGISGGVRKSVDSASEGYSKNHQYSQEHRSHHNFTDHDFEMQNNSGVLYKTTNPEMKQSKRKKDRKESMSRRPSSAGAVRPIRRNGGVTRSHEWSFRGAGLKEGAGGLDDTQRLSRTFRTTQSRERPHHSLEEDDAIIDIFGETNKNIDDAEIKSHVEQLIDENSGRWDMSGTAIDNDDEQHAPTPTPAPPIEDTDEMFQEQLDRMEIQMQRKEAQIKEAIARQKKATLEMNQEQAKLRRSYQGKKRNKKKSEELHRKRREDLFRTDIAASVDEMISNEKQNWQKCDYEANELANALDQLSEKLSKEKGNELEIRRKLKSLSKKQLKTETKLAEVHRRMGSVKMSRSDGIHQVATLETEIMELFESHEKQGEELHAQETKLKSLREIAENVEALRTNEVSSLDRDAKLIHSIELKSSLLRNRRKELLESINEVARLLKSESRRYEDHSSQLTIADVAIKAMKSVIGNFVATA